MDIILQPFGDLIHHIGLSAEKLIHSDQALLFRFNPQLVTELVEVLQVKFHLFTQGRPSGYLALIALFPAS
jgi:hypothetical protein